MFNKPYFHKLNIHVYDTDKQKLLKYQNMQKNWINVIIPGKITEALISHVLLYTFTVKISEFLWLLPSINWRIFLSSIISSNAVTASLGQTAGNFLLNINFFELKSIISIQFWNGKNDTYPGLIDLNQWFKSWIKSSNTNQRYHAVLELCVMSMTH